MTTFLAKFMKCKAEKSGILPLLQKKMFLARDGDPRTSRA